MEDDPATLAEQAEIEEAKEAAANATFEANNPEFCGNFRKDQAERVERAAAKAENANVLRLKGNRFFKAKRCVVCVETVNCRMLQYAILFLSLSFCFTSFSLEVV